MMRIRAVIPRFRGLVATSDGSILGFRRRSLLKYSPPFERPVLVGRLPWTLPQLASTWRIAERFLRQSPYRMVRTRSGVLVCTSPGGILRKDPGSSYFELAFKGYRGNRPISLCVDGDDRIYFGEYFKNPNREPVAVIMSEDEGRTWRKCYEFAAKRIRHVHGLEYDPFHNHIWVLTGDDGPEAQIGVAPPGFGDYSVFLQRDQMSRACSGICTENGFIFGTDAPSEQNRLFLANYRTKEVNAVQDLQHSVFFSGVGCGGYLVSTVVESSEMNLTDSVHVWFSHCGHRWTEVASFVRDSLSDWWFQYPSAFIASGPIDSDFCFLSMTATNQYDGSCVVMSAN